MRLAAMAGVGVGILAFFIYLMSRMASPQMELLYADLELADANAIVTKLQHDKVPYELRREGAEVWVPKDRALVAGMGGLDVLGQDGLDLLDRQPVDDHADPLVKKGVVVQ
ncbi:MAG: hypothetical protein HQL41_16755, partial [Alphaproteobacteria bacterium]|nr:hypothetical protein [Alphaproteobacteria bacterium]